MNIHEIREFLVIMISLPKSGLTSVKLFNLNGTVVKTMTFRTITGGTYSRRFDLADLPEGFYMVKIDNGGRTINKSKILYLVQSAALSG